MRIVIASHGIYPHSVGGMERHTYNLAWHLHQRGLEITVLLPPPPTHKQASTATLPFATHILPWPTHRPWLWGNWHFSCAAARWLEQNHVDIAFSQGFALWGYVKQARVPCIFHPHGLEMFGSYRRWHELPLLYLFQQLVRYHSRHATCTISLGGRLTDILREQVKVPPHKLVTIANAIAQMPPEKDFGERTPHSFMFVGRLAFNKGIDVLLQAIGTLPQLRASWTFVGDGPLRPLVEKASTQDQRVRYLGAVDDDQLAQLYQRHDFLIFASRFEGMPTVILEAMSHGCLPVASDIGAVPVMLDDQTGLMAPPTVQGVCHNLQRACQLSPESKQSMRQAARRRVENHFFWPKVVDQYLELFEKLVQAASR